MNVLLLFVGIAALVVGAELVVTNGTVLARRLRISPIIIGLTVVSIGTSLPELAVGIEGMTRGSGNLVIGNIVGTQIVNLLLIFGLMAAIRPVAIRGSTLRLDLPAVIIGSGLVWLLASNGQFHVWDGLALLAFGIGYFWIVVATARRRAITGPEAPELSAEERPPRPGSRFVVLEVGLLLAGLAIIVFGAEWMLDGAVGIAESLGVSDALIGLTVVAIGTSAPELATALASTIKGGDRGIAVGNLIGSSAMNPTIILGGSLLFGPATIEVLPALVNVSIPLMVLGAIVLVPIFLTGKKVSRLEGTLMIAAYAAYLTYLIFDATQ
ncbi:MAG: calcium/sodium antiporter [Promicromonosporaceae bacterium]|nr:calcium/sodium antiporter [Promicromonosporaceae bacterium]